MMGSWGRASSRTSSGTTSIRAAGGRAAALKEVREVHTAFLKDVTDTVEEMAVKFAGREAAVVTVTSVMSRFVTPDGVTHANERHIRTFVVARRGEDWRVLQDQNTTVTQIYL